MSRSTAGLSYPQAKRGRGGLRAATILVLVTVVALSAAGSAGAGSPWQLPPDLQSLVPTLSQDLGITADQAAARLVAGEEWNSFGGAAMQVFGDRYAGAQLFYGSDGYPSQFEIFVAHAQAGDSSAITVNSPVPVKVVSVAHSLNELETAAQAIAPLVGGTGRIAFDFPSNSLVVRPQQAVYAAMSQSQVNSVVGGAAKLGVGLTFAPDNFQFHEQECNISVCDPPIRAGTFITASGVGCTSGFVAVKGGASPTQPVWIMTAGHCIADGGSGATWSMKHVNGNLYAIGAGGNHQYVTPAGAGPDWGLIKLNSTYADPTKALNWVIAPGNSEHGITGWLAPTAGESVCFSGTTTGIVCGTTTRENSSNLWETTGMTPHPGDSGSPVWDGHNARGILDGVGANNSAYFTDVGVIWRATGVSNGGAEPRTQ
jgi:hypothetical protein